MAGDPYCYAGTNILKNKLDIRDLDGLHEAERRIAKTRELELLRSPIRGDFDFTHLQEIHRYLFQDIYEWAGKVREVDIAKGNLFCRVNLIAQQAEVIFSELSAENFLQGLGAGEFTKRLAYYLSELNALHPFREGNGRTQREFVRELAYQNDYFLAFKGVTQEEMVAASIASFGCDYGKMEELLGKCLRPI